MVASSASVIVAKRMSSFTIPEIRVYIAFAHYP
jgi:UDP-N-acetylmuramyl tripeptide synthase